MSSLTKIEIYNILSKKQIIKSKTELLVYLNLTKQRFLNFSNQTNIETNTVKYNNISTDKHINPLLWQKGHVVFFYLNLIVKNLINDESSISLEKLCCVKNINKYIEFYDSYLTPLKYRKDEMLIDNEKINKYYINTISFLQNYIIENTITTYETYLILLGILHNEMHNEAFIFTILHHNNMIPLQLNNTFKYTFKNTLKNTNNTLKNTNNTLKNTSKNNCNSNIILTDHQFIDYNVETNFVQGINDSIDFLIFDNEMPEFNTTINPFKITKYPVTEYQYLQFILDNGYNRNELWCANGNHWKNENNIQLPLYWYKKANSIKKKINNKFISVETNLPVIHISYYEAKAYCKWVGGRLPFEKEYEFVSTNKGTTQFPWGNDLPKDKYCNLN